MKEPGPGLGKGSGRGPSLGPGAGRAVGSFLIVPQNGIIGNNRKYTLLDKYTICSYLRKVLYTT